MSHLMPVEAAAEHSTDGGPNQEAALIGRTARRR